MVYSYHIYNSRSPYALRKSFLPRESFGSNVCKPIIMQAQNPAFSPGAIYYSEDILFEIVLAEQWPYRHWRYSEKYWKQSACILLLRTKDLSFPCHVKRPRTLSSCAVEEFPLHEMGGSGQTRRALRYWELRPEPDKRPEETMGYNGTRLRIECSIREWRTSKLQTLTVFNLIWESVGNFAIWPHHAYMMPIRLYWLYSSQSSRVIHPNGTTLTPSFIPKLGSQHRRGASPNIYSRYDMPAPQGWTRCIARNETKYFRLQVWSWCGWNENSTSDDLLQIAQFPWSTLEVS